MHRLGYKIPVPPKRSLKAWNALREQLLREQQNQHDHGTKASVKRRHAIEQEIRRLDSKPKNAGRQKAIQLLRKQIKTA